MKPTCANHPHADAVATNAIGWWLCQACCDEASIDAATQDSHAIAKRHSDPGPDEEEATNE